MNGDAKPSANVQPEQVGKIGAITQVVVKTNVKLSVGVRQ